MTSAPAIFDDLCSLLGGSLPGTQAIEQRSDVVVVSPRNSEEVATVTRYANASGLQIEIAGAGAKRDWGYPVAAKILLKTEQMAGVRAHSWQDMTATVAAGTPWSMMQRTLAVHRQQVALDPFEPETATVGGVIATNDSGVLRLKYGSLRDLIIGMTIVLADGTIAKSGGKVVKNVAGYDLHKLMTGAFGTLGVITEVNFRLHPMPDATKTWTVWSASPAPLGDLLVKILDAQVSLEAMQLRAGPEGYSLDVRLAALPEVLDAQVATLERLAAAITSGDRAQAPVSSEVFTTHAKLFAPTGGVILKVTMLPTAIAQLAEQVVGLGGIAVTQATGIMLARFSEEAVGRALPILSAGATAGGGHLTVLRGIPAARGMSPDCATPLMIEIKRQFDPKRVLNPGRLSKAL